MLYIVGKPPLISPETSSILHLTEKSPLILCLLVHILSNSRVLLCWCGIRDKGWLVIHIQHTSDHARSLFFPKNEGVAIKEIVAPMNEEIVITKKINSSFIGTNL